MTSSVVLLVGMAIIGSWVAGKIEASVTQNTAVATALYMDSIVAPHIQELTVQDNLTFEKQSSLDALLTETQIGSQIASFKIWKPGGLVVYSNHKSIIGQHFPETENLKLAWSGIVTAEFDSLEDEEGQQERAAGIPFLEIYSPIREEHTGRIIAVAEFYSRAELLEYDLFQAKSQSWLLVAVVAMLMLGLLFIIVQRGSRTIQSQQLALRKRILELSDLRNRLKNASRRSTELNEQFLRRIGADLHDGPAQLLGLASLRLDAIKQLITKTQQPHSPEDKDIETVKYALRDALTEIRNISAGLVLPELDNLTPDEILRKAASTHESRTHTKISLNLGELPEYVEKSIRICLYRLIQEGLNNSEHHAPNTDCSIMASFTDNKIRVEVSDAGTGFEPAKVAASSSGLGLPGLRERIESIGGQFEINSAPGQNTHLIAYFSMIDMEIEDE